MKIENRGPTPMIVIRTKKWNTIISRDMHGVVTVVIEDRTKGTHKQITLGQSGIKG